MIFVSYAYEANDHGRSISGIDNGFIAATEPTMESDIQHLQNIIAEEVACDKELLAVDVKVIWWKKMR